jgi:hypothetical protein
VALVGAQKLEMSLEKTRAPAVEAGSYPQVVEVDRHLPRIPALRTGFDACPATGPNGQKFMMARRDW